MQLAARREDQTQLVNDAKCLAIALLRAGNQAAGMEAAGIATALATDTGHVVAVFDFEEVMAEASASSGEEERHAYAAGRELGPAERIPRILGLAAGGLTTPAAAD